MLFDFNQPTGLLTPTINYGGVNRTNPILTSNNIFQLDENDDHFPSLTPKNNEYNLTTKDNTNENSDNNQEQDDLFSTFDFSVLSELDKTELQIDDLQFEKYLTQSSYPSPATDIHNSFLSDDSTSPWIAAECTIESENMEDMMVPPSPSLSSTSRSPLTAEKRSTKKGSISVADRKLRKKDQNKTAAEKYRLKKREERNELIARHLDLKNQNKELKFEFENLTFRMEQFKQLFVDVLQIPIPSTK